MDEPSKFQDIPGSKILGNAKALWCSCLVWSIRQHSQALGLPAGMNFAARPSSTKLLVGAVVSPRMNLPFGIVYSTHSWWNWWFTMVYYWFHLWFKHSSNQLRVGTGTGECLGKGEATAHEWMNWDSAPSTLQSVRDFGSGTTFQVQAYSGWAWIWASQPFSQPAARTLEWNPDTGQRLYCWLVHLYKYLFKKSVPGTVTP